MMNTNLLKKLPLGALLVVVVLALSTVLALRGGRPSDLPSAERSVTQFTLTKADVVSVLAGSRASAASVTFDLCASDGSIALPDGAVVPVWGFVDISGGGPCTPGLVSSLPGPVLRAVAGDTVTINLSNALAVPTSILIPGLNLSPAGGTAGMFAQEAAAGGGTVSYTFTAQEGAYLYESGTESDTQIAMGLYGALAVESSTAGLAYGYAFDREEVLVLSEIDPNLNANPATFNMQDYKPVYWLINGQAYPATSPIAANAGERILLRYINAGFDNLSMSILGAHQWLIARNGFETPSAYQAVAETVAAGQTMETIVDSTGLNGPLALFNRNLYLTNAATFPGGMLTFLEVQGAVGSPPALSFVSPALGSSVAGATTVQISASDVEDAAGSLSVEWNVAGDPPQPATYNGGTGYYEAGWDTTAYAEGPIVLEARAADSDGNTSSTSIDVIVDNVDDPPFVIIVYPNGGDLLTGSVTVEVDASDDRGLTQVEFFDFDGTNTTSAGVDSDGSDGWSIAWDTSLGPDGLHTLTATATDTGANTSSHSLDVTLDNSAPSISFASPADGATVSGLVTLTVDASDGTSGVSQVEFFVNGSSIGLDANGGDGWSVDWDTSDLNAGIYSLTATATNGVGLNASDTIAVTVDNPAQSTLHAGDLNATTSIQNQGQPNERWTATVTARVHDATEAPVSGANVSFEVAWINKNNGNTQTANLSCTTGATGQCQVSRTFMSSNTEDIVSFTVTGISHASLAYDPGANHDPDPSPGPDVVDNRYSDGTTIEVEVVRP